MRIMLPPAKHIHRQLSSLILINVFKSKEKTQTQNPFQLREGRTNGRVEFVDQFLGEKRNITNIN